MIKLGLDEPAYAGFAGASLSLNIPISKNELENWQEYNHCMEVHKTGVCLAWQGRIRDSRKPDNKELFLGGAGTKAYYGGEEPTINEAFAKNRTLLQLQMFNDVVPQIVSLAFGKDTTGQKLTQQHMNILVEKGIAKRWVGRRGVLYDGFPIIGHLYCKGKQVSNARGTAYFGSGGGSFALIASLVSHYALHPEDVKSELETLGLNHVFLKSVLEFSDSRRVAKESD
jgi:hypothetical protein